MISNLIEYFLPEQEYYLNEIEYKKIDIFEDESTLTCEDQIDVELDKQIGIRVIVTREIYFEPESIFKIKVSFGTDLRFNPENVMEYKWDELNLAEEFKENGDFVTRNLMSRISLLIAQITSSFGQQPIVTPPGILSLNNK